LVAASQALAKEPVQFLGLSIKSNDDGGVSQFVKRHNVPYPILHGANQTMQQYGLRGIPVTLIIDPQGKIRDTLYGPQETEGIIQRVKSVLQTNST